MKSVPKFFNLLSDADKLTYYSMQTQFTISMSRNQRNKRVSMFNQILSIIQRFCLKKDKNDWIRCFVCGVMWLPEGIAINNQQLRILISKCKSSINGSLVRIGYTNNLGRAETAAALVKAVPILKDNASELRQWTLRTKNITETPQIPKKPLIKVILGSSSSPILPQLPSPIINTENISYLLPILSVKNKNQEIKDVDDDYHQEDEFNNDDAHFDLPKYESVIESSLDPLYRVSAGFDFDFGIL